VAGSSQSKGRPLTKEDFGHFVRSVRSAALRSLRHRVGDHADDVFQMAVTSFLTVDDSGVPEYERYSRGALYAVFLNKRLPRYLGKYIRERRKGAWKYQSPLFDQDCDKQLVSGADAGHEALDEIKNLPLWALTTRQLEVLDRFYVHELTQAQIADAFSVSQKTISLDIKRALETLSSDGMLPSSEEQYRRQELQVALVEALARAGRNPAAVLQGLVQQLAASRRPFPIDPSESDEVR